MTKLRAGILAIFLTFLVLPGFSAEAGIRARPQRYPIRSPCCGRPAIVATVNTRTTRTMKARDTPRIGNARARP